MTDQSEQKEEILNNLSDVNGQENKRVKLENDDEKLLGKERTVTVASNVEPKEKLDEKHEMDLRSTRVDDIQKDEVKEEPEKDQIEEINNFTSAEDHNTTGAVATSSSSQSSSISTTKEETNEVSSKKPTKDGEKTVENVSIKGTEKDKEFEVPLSAINKILKAALPEGAVCTKDAKSAFSKAAGIFVLYITACANDIAKSSKRQTITAQDITTALNELGYSSFLPHLEATLEKMKLDSANRKSIREKKKESTAAS